MSCSPILEVENLSIKYKTKDSIFYAVSAVSFQILPGETLALVGKSGCGKSSIAKALLGISSISEGEIYYQNTLISRNRKKTPGFIKKDIQMIFQDPYSSLNPRMTIEEIIKEPLYIYKIGTKVSQRERVDELLTNVQLPLHYKNRYPHELSGGERQRVSIARALASNPKLLVCDEPTHALDVSVQAAIINLLKDLRDKFNLSMLFISHDLSLVKNISDKCLIMYNGKIIESGSCDSIFKNPKHTFTIKLLSSIPLFGEVMPEFTSTPEEHIPVNIPISLDSNIFAMQIQKLQKRSAGSLLSRILAYIKKKKSTPTINR